MMQYPLSSHLPGDVIAHRLGETITAGQFHQEAVDLAGVLPASSFIINTCQDRYLFMLGFAAAALAGKTTLMPSSFAPNTISQLQSRYPDLLCLHDGRDLAHGLPDLKISARSSAELRSAPAPLIDAEQVVSIVFTSGSTGEPTAHAKRWGLLCLNGASESERLGARGMAIVATVPPQHMYGFESSVLLTLHGGSSMWHGKPFYPADITEALDATPRPRMLVTTPFHLSTLMAAGLPLPPCDTVLSATAPLALPLAQRAEGALKAPLLEIYGCTESGQVASRRPSEDAAWQLLAGVQMDTDTEGAWVFGGHVEGRVLLSDYIETQSAGRFILLGRHEDMVNIAGKRTSISHLNAQLQTIPGVLDGCFLQPDAAAAGSGDGEGVQRLAALVVAPSLSVESILEQLRVRVDAVFLPRPVLRVETLPRNATGKLVRSELLALYATLRS
ncbi:AMP-binding protein [Ottowia thiooxydans]|uniref:AMP-binding protein n=1 Tax=Ottowia thiooxydans TaxID=219182 RepID=UPI0003FA613B|nr:AMP-binding protein [Ottowia thiooxydans]